MAAPLVPSWATQYVGLPYVAGGRTHDGIDCWGLINLVWSEQLGVTLPPYEGATYFTEASTDAVATDAAAFASRYVPVDLGQERLGDGILIRMRGHPLHVAMVLAPGIMLHVEQGADACIEPYGTFRWAKRIIGIYRYEAPHG
jgi:cell wall-associated NlpC family hydrolase